MAILAHPRTEGFGARDPSTTTADLIDRAIATAAGRPSPRRGLLRRLLGPRSAASVIRRYSLRPAIDQGYAQIVRALGAVRVEMSVEESAGEEYLAMDCFFAGGDVDRMIEVEQAVQRQVHATFGDRRWLRLLVSINPEVREPRAA
jgi:hypothetical protein